jgi:hypothetical protein
LDEQALQAQAGLADVFFDEPQAVFGVLLNLLHALFEVIPPLGDVLFEQVALTLSHNFIDEFFQVQTAGGRGAIDRGEMATHGISKE